MTCENAMKDMVIGAITNYNFDQIKHWVNSLNRSGFDGLKVVLCYNIHPNVMEELSNRGFIPIRSDNSGTNIMSDRFYHYWMIINQLSEEYELRYVIATDVGDVVFQKNPSSWVNSNLHHSSAKIIASSESIKYKDESWGRQNLSRSFNPVIYENYKNKLIANAGVMAGYYEYMKDLFLNIFLTCGGAPKQVEGGGGPDQAAYNILINSKVYESVVNFCNSDSGWAAQLGTIGPQVRDRFGQYIVDTPPVLKGDEVCTSSGEPFTVVHQYNRVPEWRDIIWNKYND